MIADYVVERKSRRTQMLPGMVMPIRRAPAALEIPAGMGTPIGDMTDAGGLAAAFDGVTSQAGTGCARRFTSVDCWIGKSFASPRIFHSATLYGANNLGFVPLEDPTVTIVARGKNGDAPSSRTDGTALGSISFTDPSGANDPPEEHTITSTDLFAAWDHIFFDISKATGTDRNMTCAEVRMWESA